MQIIKSIDRYDLQSHAEIANFFPAHFPDDHYRDEAEMFKAKYGNPANVTEMYKQDKRWVVSRDRATKDLGGIMLIGERAPEQIHVFWVIVAEQLRRQGIARKIIEHALSAPENSLTRSQGATSATFTASIKEGNTSSEELFLSLGFTKVSATDYLSAPEAYSKFEFNNDGTMNLWIKRDAIAN